MKWVIAATVAFLSVAPASGTVRYDFSAQDGNAFVLETANFVSPSLIFFNSGDLVSCTNACVSISFNGGYPGYDQIGYQTPSAGYGYYFSTTAFETYGSYQSIIGYTPATLTVSEVIPEVPEPAMLGLFGFGAIGLGLARRRRAA